MEQRRTPLTTAPTPYDAHRVPAAEAVRLPQRPALPTTSPTATSVMERVLSCIDLRLAETVHVCELAEEVHMSPFHFTRMFKLATGHSPHKYITLKRVERAKELLATSDMAIAAIAAAVGYATQAHFTGVFSRHAGTTPKVFRVAQRRATPPARTTSAPPATEAVNA